MVTKYDEIMDRVSLSDESRERILQKTRKAASKYGDQNPDSKRAWLIKYLAVAACFVLLLSGSFVMFRGSRNAQSINTVESANEEDFYHQAAEKEGDKSDVSFDTDEEFVQSAGEEKNQKDGDQEDMEDAVQAEDVQEDADFKTIRIIALVIIVSGLGLSGYLHLRRLTRSDQEKDPEE